MTDVNEYLKKLWKELEFSFLKLLVNYIVAIDLGMIKKESINSF